MEKLDFYKIVIAVLLLLNLGTLGFLWYNRPPRPGQEGPFRFLVQTTGMDESQQKAYAELRDRHHQKMMDFRQRNGQIRDKLYALLGADTSKNAEIAMLTDSIASLRREEEQLTFQHFQAVRALCRPDQQTKFDAAIGEAIRSMGPPPPGRNR